MDYKGYYTLNPKRKSEYDVKQYEFLGVLMDCAFRTDTFLAVDLPKIFWKKFVNEKIDEKDLE